MTDKEKTALAEEYWKKNWKEQGLHFNDQVTKRNIEKCYLDGLKEGVIETEILEKEIEELKNQNLFFSTQLIDCNERCKDLEKENEELKTQLEKMKCKNSYTALDKNSNAVPCFTIYSCEHCNGRRVK